MRPRFSDARRGDAAWGHLGSSSGCARRDRLPHPLPGLALLAAFAKPEPGLCQKGPLRPGREMTPGQSLTPCPRAEDCFHFEQEHEKFRPPLPLPLRLLDSGEESRRAARSSEAPHFSRVCSCRSNSHIVQVLWRPGNKILNPNIALCPDRHHKEFSILIYSAK